MIVNGERSQEQRPLACAIYSSDGGRTWSDRELLNMTCGKGYGTNCSLLPTLVRLDSGCLGLAYTATGEHFSWLYHSYFHISEDEGATWSEAIPITPSPCNQFTTYDSCTKLSDGRLILPFQRAIGPTSTKEDPELYRKFGELFYTALLPKMYVSACYYSDDEGQSWQVSRNETFATIDGGVGGNYTMGLPNVSELDDGRLLMLGNSDLGRMFRSYSEDRGQTWQVSEPVSDLVYRRGASRMTRIPGSKDLLLIWTQLSGFEALQGLNRHRLSCAISKDCGLSWQYHKNLESLDDVSYIEPDSSPLHYHVGAGTARQPIDRERYHRAPGPLRVDHPFCTFIDGKAVICYGFRLLGDKSVIEKTYGLDYVAEGRKFGFEPDPQNPKKLEGVNKVRVIPIEWFYS